MCHKIKISHVSIIKWFRKYTRLIKGYVDHLIPEFSEVWSVDEMMVNVKDTTQSGVGFYDWMWSIISPQTRFVIASEISKRREVGDAKAIFQSGKRKTESTPSYVITDSLRTLFVYDGDLDPEAEKILKHYYSAVVPLHKFEEYLELLKTFGSAPVKVNTNGADAKDKSRLGSVH
jgi:transposase-like protein